MLIKDKDILAEEEKADTSEEKKLRVQKPRINRENMRAAWGDAFDYYLRGITEKYLLFRGRATRLEFWGYAVAQGIVLIPLYFLGDYVDMPLLVYYYLAATAIPFVGLMTRRFHDVNKSAAIYLISGFILLSGALLSALLDAFIIRCWAISVLLLWIVVVVRIFSLPTDISEGLYGGPNENDEIYGDDNIRIIHKFRLLALSLMVMWLGVTYINFDNWSRQAQATALKDDIMEQIEVGARQSGLSKEQAKVARQLMEQTLKTWSGQEVQEEDISKAVNDVIKGLMTPPQPEADTKKAE